jgi:hypothetical protein
MNRLLLFTDLDRTLLPNGSEPESPGARERFTSLAARPEIELAYVTGRDPARVDEAISTWNVPVPDLLLADVGSTIASRRGKRWERLPSWDAIQAADWSDRSPEALQRLLRGMHGLTLQEPCRQTRFKLSYLTPGGDDGTAVAESVRSRLVEARVRANVIWSLDDSTGDGLLDVLPGAASKLLAIEFVLRERSRTRSQALFAGDSGNDLDVLVSSIPAVLVANAGDEMRESAVRQAEANGNKSALYCARGGALGMNGCYAAGILEGVLHYHPELAPILEGGA